MEILYEKPKGRVQNMPKHPIHLSETKDVKQIGKESETQRDYIQALEINLLEMEENLEKFKKNYSMQRFKSNIFSVLAHQIVAILGKSCEK